MKKIKVFSLISILIITLQLLAIVPASATESIYEGLPYKTVEVNVAQYKPVSIGTGTENASYPVSNITDGNRETFADFTYSNQITIDLMRRYNVKRIELYARLSYANESWCKNFKVYGSNDEEFAEKTELHNYGEYNADIFPVKGSYSFDVDDKNAYRYIRVEYPQSVTWLGYGDIRVFADIDVTQVSKPGQIVTTAPESHYYPGSNLIDGSNDTFVYPDYTGFSFFTVDLENEYPIGMIELDSRADGGDAYNVHYGISTYGSNSLIDNETNAGKPKLTDDGYTKLTWIQPVGNFSAYDATNPDMQFKRYSKNTNEYPCYQEVCKDTESFRYITIKDDEQSCLQASEMRAYVINPKAYSAQWDGENVSISFSDVMLTETLNTDNITVMNGNEQVDDLVISQVDNGYGVNLSAGFLPSTEYTLIVSKNVTNENGVPMISDFSFSFQTPALIEVVEGSFKVTDGNLLESQKVESLSEIESGTIGVQLTIRNNSVDVDDEAVVLALLYNDDGILVDADESRMTLLKGSDTPVLLNGFTVDTDTVSDYKLYVYVWRDFNLMLPWSLCEVID